MWGTPLVCIKSVDWARTQSKNWCCTRLRSLAKKVLCHQHWNIAFSKTSLLLFLYFFLEVAKVKDCTKRIGKLILFSSGFGCYCVERVVLKFAVFRTYLPSWLLWEVAGRKMTTACVYANKLFWSSHTIVPAFCCAKKADPWYERRFRMLLPYFAVQLVKNCHIEFTMNIKKNSQGQ